MSLGSNKSLVLHVLFLVLTSCSDGGMRLELGILTYTNAPDRMAWVVTSINPIYAFHLALGLNELAVEFRASVKNVRTLLHVLIDSKIPPVAGCPGQARTTSLVVYLPKLPGGIA